MTDPYGRLIGISDGLPGSTHDLTAARTHNVFGVADRAGLYLYADKGYAGGEGPFLLTPYKGRSLPDSYRQANRCHAAVRANGERGFAVLKSWKVFDRFRGCPRHVGAFARAVLTLEHGPEKEHGKSSLLASSHWRWWCGQPPDLTATGPQTCNDHGVWLAASVGWLSPTRPAGGRSGAVVGRGPSR